MSFASFSDKTGLVLTVSLNLMRKRRFCAKCVLQVVDAAYEEIVYWRRTLILRPSGAAEKSFVGEAER